MALGIDWFFDVLSESTLNAAQNAIYEKAFVPGLEAYAGKLGVSGWWVSSGSNWNTVCNSGLAIAALALSDSENSTIASAAQSILVSAFDSIPSSMSMWAPSGVWWEGPSYTDYTSKYASALLASCNTAMNSPECGLNITGLDQAGMWVINLIAPSGLVYDWADSFPFAWEVTASNMFFFASRFNNSAYAYAARELLLNNFQGIADVIAFVFVLFR